jgi:hypothetical protein
VGKLPRSKAEEHDEDVSKRGAWATLGSATDTTSSVLESDRLASLFSSWKREKTLFILPSLELKGLKGFQRLPLQTCPLELPWSRPGQSNRKLFDGLPSDSIKPTSLLEALAASKRGATVLLPEDDFTEEAETEARNTRLQQEVEGSVKDAASAENEDFLAPQTAEAEDDQFATIQPQSFLASALPDVPLALDEPASGSAGAAVEQDSLLESPGSSTGGLVGETPTEQDQGRDEKEERSLEKKLDETARRIAAMQDVLQRERGELHRVEQHVLETQTTGQDLQKQLARQKQLVAMLPQAQANIAKLEAICQTNAQKKVEIAQQMETARGPLLKEFAGLEGQRSGRKARCRQLIREIKAFRAEMLEITGVIQSKMESLRALERVQERQMAKPGKETASDGGPMTRNMYTSRIMDIIKQVHKQKQDIAKILADIKGLQKHLNTASEKLKRTEAVAEDKLYSAASKSKSSSSSKAEAYVECYRKFAQVRELFEELILVVADVGKKENTARDLHNWISQLEARDSSSHLDKVLADLESVRLENGTLQSELRARIG